MESYLHRIRLVPNSALVQGLSLALIVVGLVGTVVRIQRQYDVLGGPYENAQGGMFDFHNGVYQPAMGLRDGVIPYSQELVDRYQVTRPTPAYSPFIVAVHIPLTYLPMQTAEVVYFVAIFVMMTIASCLIADDISTLLGRWYVLPILAVMVISRSGHATLFSGYFTMELVLGTFVALRFADQQPWLSGIGILFASGKPTFAIPLGIVMLARGNYRALAIGVAFSILGAVLPFCFLASRHGWQAIVDAIRLGQENHLADPTEFPVNTWTRIDFAAIVCKWMGTNPGEIYLLLAMIPLIAWPAFKLWQMQKNGDRTGIASPSGTIAVLGLLTSLYHHAYDALLVCGGLGSLFFSRQASFVRLGMFRRMTIALLISAPLWNYASSETILTRLPDIPKLRELLSSINGIALILGMLGLLINFTPENTAASSRNGG